MPADEAPGRVTIVVILGLGLGIIAAGIYQAWTQGWLIAALLWAQ